MPVTGNIDALGNPHFLLGLHIVNELCQAQGTARPAYKTIVETNRHHFGQTVFAFFKKAIKAISQILMEVFASVESLGRGKAHIIGIKGVEDDQVLAASLFFQPSGQVIGTIVGGIKKSSHLHHQLCCVHGTAARVPSEWPPS